MIKFKLTKKKECRVLTWQGRIIVLLLVVLMFGGFFKYMPVFLSVNKPIGGNILVLDGLMPDFSVKEAINIFNSGQYDLIIATGGKIQTGYTIAGNQTMAEFTASSLVSMGFDREKVVTIPGGENKRDRTYNSALTLKKWMENNNPEIKKIDVLAVGSHARRSRLLFKKALKNECEVGIVSVQDPAYDPDKWWRTSVGVRTVLSEAIAYFYVLLFFYD